MPTYDMTAQSPPEIKTGDILNYPYSGEAIATTLPPGRYKIEAWGAQGGDYGTTALGGRGGYAVGTLTVSEETLIFVRAGGKGTNSTTSGSYTDGGFNGGGKAGYRYGGSGGGASDIRLRQDSLYARVLTAGAGGAFGYTNYNGGYGGGTSGGKGTGYSDAYAGKPGTQTAGGASTNYAAESSPGTFGAGGDACQTSSSYNRAAGGGGGWYGGGGTSYRGSSSYYYRGGGGAGGGSGYVYTAETAANYPDGCLLTARDYLTDAQNIAGSEAFGSPTGVSETGHTGDGYARVTAIEVFPTVPSAPKGFAQTGKEYFSISLAWSASELAAGYRLWRDGELIADLTGLTYTDTGVSPNGTYTYTLRGYNAEGLGDPATLTAKTTQGYAIIRPEITAASFDVNPADINTKTILTVAVEDKILILHPEVWYAGEIYAGEITDGN